MHTHTSVQEVCRVPHGQIAPSIMRVVNTAGAVRLDVDGRLVAELGAGDRVLLEASAVPYPLLTTKQFDPWQRLRDRLGWSGNFG